MAGDAAEIKMWATRGIGRVMEEQRQAGLMAKGTRGHGRPKIGGGKNPPPKEPTLEEQGVDKDLAKVARSYFKIDGARRRCRSEQMR